MNTLWQDVRYGLKLLAKKPGFTLAAVLSLSLGIGANAAIFTLVNAVLFRTAPIADPDRQMYIYTGTRDSLWSSSSYPNYVDLRDRNEVFEGMAAFSEISVSLSRDESADLVRGMIVSGNFFDVLGVRAAHGRVLSPADDHTPNGHPVAVITHNLWQRRFAADPNIIGQEMQLNGQAFTITGITPEGFKGTDILESYEVYVPMMMQAMMRPPRAGFSSGMDADLLGRRGSGWLRVVGKLKPGVSMEQAQANLSILAAQLEQAYPDINRGRVVSLFPLTKLAPRAYTPVVNAATLLLAVVGMVLLIACANLANLMLARATARRKEIAVRLALGASRWRLIRQLLTESLLLAFIGGAAGLLLAWWTLDVLYTSVPRDGIFSFTLDYRIDLRVLAFTFGISLLTGIAFGLAPALQASKPNLLPVLKDEAYALGGGLRRFNLRSSLVVAQMALSLVLLIGAGLFLLSLRNAQNIDPGFDADKVLTASLNISLLRYNKAQGRAFYREVTERIAALPGVEAVSLARIVPVSGSGRIEGFWLEGQTSDPTDPQRARQGVSSNVVGLDYFRTMGIALQKGRDFQAQDEEGSVPVVIVNEAFANRYFAGEEVLGKRISIDGERGPWREIVGLVRDSKYRQLSEDPTPFMYRPLAQNHETGMALHVRTTGDPMSLAAGVRHEIQEVEKNLPVTDLQRLSDLLSSALFPARMGAWMLVGFGLLALVLAAVGLYGVMAYTVAQRTHEIGVRMALGATRKDVVKLIVGHGMRLTLIGVGVGLGAAYGLTRLLQSFLFDVSSSNGLTFFAITVLLCAVAGLASYLPARRAMKVDPMVALRYE